MLSSLKKYHFITTKETLNDVKLRLDRPIGLIELEPDPKFGPGYPKKLLAVEPTKNPLNRPVPGSTSFGTFFFLLI